MAMVSNVEDFLTAKLYHDKEPVTYRLLSRHCCISAQQAKVNLESYAIKHPQFYPVYCLVGVLLNSKDAALSLRIVRGEERETAKRAFFSLSEEHFYCLVPYQPKNLSIIVAIDAHLPPIPASSTAMA
ncbi:hypothetical protein BDF14DRAFT_1039631 [Spinellus fusiger]|nr:hypothetical protein BDF14DRAFT_1039631 [Spinellus fusiger]